MARYEGGCLCGSIRFGFDGEPTAFTYCHCVSCRKASGSAFAANATVARDTVALEDGKGTLREFESSPGKMRAFCSRCGSPVFAYRMDAPNALRIRMGLLDSAYAQRPTSHIWVSEMPGWDQICDDVTQSARSVAS